MNRKAQAYISDFIIGFMIFAIGGILVSRFIIQATAEDNFEKVRINAETVSDYLVSEGTPGNWTNETVVVIGLTTNHRLNMSKLEMLYSMPYGDTRKYLAADYDYLIFFQKNGIVFNFTRCSYGAINITDCTANITGIDYDNMVRVNRLLLQNSSLIEMVLYVWD